MALSFSLSESLSIGVEVELQLVDRDTLALTPTSSRIIDGLGGLGGAVKHELMMSNLEIVTGKCREVDEAAADLYGRLDRVLQEAKRHNTLLCSSGTHPFSSWEDQEPTADDRYKRLMGSLGGVARRFNIFGLHVHVGIGDGDKCIYVMNRMLSYLPHLLALSANSPFWEGEDTGLRSYRTVVFDALPTAGLPFYLDDWNHYSELVDCYIRTNTIESIREIWWDVRPHPDFGTIEIRICDMPPTIREALAITALIQALVGRLLREYDEGVPLIKTPSYIVRQNKWRACRYGLSGELITNDGRATVSTKEAVLALIKSLRREAEALDSSHHLAIAQEIAQKGDGASRQLEVWRTEGRLESVVGHLIRTLQADVESECP